MLKYASEFEVASLCRVKIDTIILKIPI